MDETRPTEAVLGAPRSLKVGLDVQVLFDIGIGLNRLLSVNEA